MCEPGDYSSESLALWFSKCGPGAAAFLSPVDAGRAGNADSESETPGWGPAVTVCPGIPRGVVMLAGDWGPPADEGRPKGG